MKKLLILLSIFLLTYSCNSQTTIPLTNWKFTTGDNLDWSAPSFNEYGWKSIKSGLTWEEQGLKQLKGYGWYRIRFYLPSSLKEKGFFKDSLSILLGKIDEFDQTFLNGNLLGQNAKLVPAGTSPVEDLSKTNMAWYTERSYIIPADDPRLLWDRENVIAVRAFDVFSSGGLHNLPQLVKMRDIDDYLITRANPAASWSRSKGMLTKSIIICNNSPVPELEGLLTIRIVDEDSKKPVASKKMNVKLNREDAVFSVSFDGSESQRLRAVCTFATSRLDYSFASLQLPYILTPAAPQTPRINGAKLVGVRPGSPFIFKIPATGQKPLRYSVDYLPEGLTLDPATGVISGRIENTGEYKVRLVVSNSLGTDRKNFTIKVGNLIGLTPAMGWNSWNCWGLEVSADKLRSSALALIQKGLVDHGWTYMNIDDGWEAAQRDAAGNIVPNEKFPDMKGLGDWLHQRGLKFGIYSSPGTKTCGGYLGSYGHELQDANSYGSWGIDYLKYDWCSYGDIYQKEGDTSVRAFMKPYQLMQKGLAAQNRDIYYSLCQYGMHSVWNWGAEVGGNSWRTTGDVTDYWPHIKMAFNQYKAAPYSGPGHWNDPDMLVVGMVGWGEHLHPTRLTPEEQYLHISLWSLLSAPLMIGCDISRLDDFTLSLLTNDEVIAIDQDPLGKQGVPVIEDKNYQVIVKELEDGSKAVGLFNLSEKELKIKLPFDALQLSGKQKIRNLWTQKELGIFSNQFESKVPSHGVVLIKLTKQN